MIVIYTTFIRPKLVEKTLPSYLKFFDGKILVLDQGKKEDRIEEIVRYLNSERLLYYKLPFDIGLSASRNFGVRKAKELNEKHVLITADSIKLIEPLKAEKIKRFLDLKNNYAVVGLELRSRIPWELDMKLTKNGWFFDLPQREKIIFEKIEFQPCDIVRNFFIGKTETLLDLWNEELKLGEHELAFYNLKQKGYKVFATKSLKADYIKTKPFIYNAYRNRTYSEFIPKVKERYNIIGSYFNYSDRLKNAFENWKKRTIYKGLDNSI